MLKYYDDRNFLCNHLRLEFGYEIVDYNYGLNLNFITVTNPMTVSPFLQYSILKVTNFYF